VVLQSERVQWLRGNLTISDFSISHAPRQRFVGLNAACGSDCERYICSDRERGATFRFGALLHEMQ